MSRLRDTADRMQVWLTPAMVAICEYHAITPAEVLSHDLDESRGGIPKYQLYWFARKRYKLSMAGIARAVDRERTNLYKCWNPRLDKLWKQAWFRKQVREIEEKLPALEEKVWRWYLLSSGQELSAGSPNWQLMTSLPFFGTPVGPT